MADLPEIAYGTVHGRFLAGILDSNDPEVAPDVVPLSGSVEFWPTADTVLVAGASPDPTTLLPQKVCAPLDGAGYLVNPDTGDRGVTLFCTDDPDGNPINWHWRAVFRLTLKGRAVPRDGFYFALPCGSDVDLTVVAPVAIGDDGVWIIQGPPGVSAGDIIEAQGDLITGDAVGDAAILPVGAPGTYLAPEPAAPLGLEWKPLPAPTDVSPATEVDAGVARYATQAEVDLGAEADATVRPSTLAPYVAAAIGAIPVPDAGLKVYPDRAAVDAVRVSEVGVWHVPNVAAEFAHLIASNPGIFDGTGPADLVVTSTVSDFPLNSGSTVNQAYIEQTTSMAIDVKLRRSWKFERPDGPILVGSYTWVVVNQPPKPSGPDQTLVSAPGVSPDPYRWEVEYAISLNYAGAVVRRDVNGRAQIAAPERDTEIANKVYVDTAIGAIPPGAVEPATDAVAGVARYSTQAEVDLGTDLDSTVRPGTLAPFVAAAIAAIPPASGGTPPVGTRNFLFDATPGGDPGAGRVSIENAGGQNRLLRVSKTDADGGTVNLAPLAVGDAVILSGGPAIYARGYAGTLATDAGTWWEFTAVRESGTGALPADATPLVLTITMANGGGGSVTLPARLGVYGAVPPGNDWNNAAENGWYMSNVAANSPVPGTWFIGQVLAHDPDYTIQVLYTFTDAATPRSYRRDRIQGSWGTWRDAAVVPARLAEIAQTATDWNTAATNGFFHSNPTAANAPFPSGNWIGVVTAHNPQYTVQEVVCYANDNSRSGWTMRRRQEGGTWTPWERLYQTAAEIKSMLLAPPLTQSLVIAVDTLYTTTDDTEGLILHGGGGNIHFQVLGKAYIVRHTGVSQTQTNLSAFGGKLRGPSLILPGQSALVYVGLDETTDVTLLDGSAYRPLGTITEPASAHVVTPADAGKLFRTGDASWAVTLVHPGSGDLASPIILWPLNGNALTISATAAINGPTTVKGPVRVDYSYNSWVIEPLYDRDAWLPAPVSAVAAGTAGDRAYDADFLYVCVAQNQWKRTPLAAW